MGTGLANPAHHDIEATLEWVEIDDVSLPDGSYRKHPGTPSVFNDVVGYNVCSDLDPALPFLQHPRAQLHALFIHEVMHSFGIDESTDHFGTPDCDEKGMRGLPYDDGRPATSQEFCGICPNAYKRFVDGYSPCN